MKAGFLFAIPAALAASGAMAQTSQGPAACAADAYRQLDFWVGDWDLDWQGRDGRPAHGHNHISRTLGDCAIQEDFDGRPGVKLSGRSLSIYDARLKLWRQTWVDDQGGVFVLTGEPRGPDFVLETATFGPDSQNRSRMVFTDIGPDSFVWLWQQSKDAGKNWATGWRINYRRAAAD